MMSADGFLEVQIIRPVGLSRQAVSTDGFSVTNSSLVASEPGPGHAHPASSRTIR